MSDSIRFGRSTSLVVLALVLGSVENLVLLLRFSNHGPAGQNRTLPSAANVTTIMNAVGGDPILAPTGSVRDHYLENSYGQFTIDSTVVGWLDMPNTEVYYADGDSGGTPLTWDLITEGLEAADPLVDFADFDVDGDGWIDAITFLHSGYGAEFGGFDQYGTYYVDRMWSHKWTIPTWTSNEGVKVGDYSISPGLWDVAGSPPWLSLSAAGVLSGTPTELGLHTFRVRVSDAANRYDQRLLSLAVVPFLLDQRKP